MLPEELNEREKNILRHIVQQFILTASPVGSRNITKRYDLGYSPATVRNIMSDLEEFGFLGHPHTSAGRVPTDKGYRFYVNALMETHTLAVNEQELIAKQIESAVAESDGVLDLASKLLGRITNQLACVVYPSLDNGILEKIQIITLSSSRIMVIISVRSGLVKTIQLEVNFEVNEKQLHQIQQLLNERLQGLGLREIRESFKDRLKDSISEDKPILRLFYESVDKIFVDLTAQQKLFVNGASNLLKQPEFEDPDRFQSVVELIEDKEIIIHILDKVAKNSNDAVQVSIGLENDHINLENYSLVTKEYKFGATSGTLGIVGPKRMEYSKIVAIVDYTAKILTEFLTRNQ